MTFLNLLTSLTMVSTESGLREIACTNDIAVIYGLQLSPEDAREIMIARETTLKDYGRIELDTSITDRIIRSICPSPYLQQREYAHTVMELHELFHYLKNELEDSVGDDELIAELTELYNTACRGDLELLKGRETERIIRRFRFGKEEEPDAKEEKESDLWG